MDQDTPQAQPSVAQPQPEAQIPTPAPQPETPAANPTPAPVQNAVSAPACKCPVVSAADWDKKKMVLNKTFYKTFSPRVFYYPFSFAIDLARAKTASIGLGYHPVENGMILDTGGMFVSTVMIEVTNANESDPNVVSLMNKEVYTKVSKRPWKEMKLDIAELEKELGKKPAQLYLWWTSCPKCASNKEIKTVFVAVP